MQASLAEFTNTFRASHRQNPGTAWEVLNNDSADAHETAERQ